MTDEHGSSLKTLQDIRSIMERSARFISLSGWSGIWAGATALAGSYIAHTWLEATPGYVAYETAVPRFIMLAFAVLIIAFIGAWYFTWRKTSRQGGTVWNSASKRMLAQITLPMLAGAIFAFKFLFDEQVSYVAPTCLAFYGLALINGSKYTLSDIKYLGLLEVALGCNCLFIPGYGLLFWAIGFGALHVLYGIIMWNKYDKHISREELS